MKKIFALAVASLVLAATINAADQPAAKTRPFRGTIKTINKAAQTIVLKGPKAQTFKILAETKMQREGKPVGFEDIATGDTLLGGFARQAPDGHWDALKLNLAAKAPDAAGSPSPATKVAPTPKVPKAK
ncbi:MAG TPA: hypothetical protein VJ063_14075 [Verrucomicrobiae bacterium]|nr:hypothetical protein [Verrucomicrobiae bacterium]